MRAVTILGRQVFSLIGDFFSPHQRAFVAALVQIAMGAGMSLGQLVAGVLGARRRPWLCISKACTPLDTSFCVSTTALSWKTRGATRQFGKLHA